MVYKLYHITYYTIVALFVKLGFIRRKRTELLYDSFILEDIKVSCSALLDPKLCKRVVYVHFLVVIM